MIKTELREIDLTKENLNRLDAIAITFEPVEYRLRDSLSDPPPARVFKLRIQAFIKRLLLKYARLTPGATIIDPCMGSGTTIKAAVEMGYKAVGIDINPVACAIAVKRLVGGDKPKLKRMALYD